MSNHRIIVITSMILFIITLSYAIVEGAMGFFPSFEVRELARFYLNNTYNPYNRFLSAMTPEAVTAIVWDFRGLDTLFETSVFYLAIISTVLLMRDLVPRYRKPKGLSLITKTGTKIVCFMILIVASAIALHGHLTPGGGFQAGSTAAVITGLVIVIFSFYELIHRGVSKEKLLMLRSLGLIGVFITSISLFIIGVLLGYNTFIMQNQPKKLAELGYPYKINGIIISGTPFLLNLFEAVAVFMAFSILFFTLAIPEEDALSSMREGDNHGY